MKYGYVVVGAGFAGAIMARRIAEELSENVLVVEKSSRPGGHASDGQDESGVLVHDHGPHIFHTSNDAVWSWLGRFTSWHEYEHRVLAYVEGKLVPLPICAETIRALYGLDLNREEMAEWLDRQAVKKERIETSEDVALSSVGRDLYEKLFLNYTRKQWGVDPSKLDPSVIRRIPVRFDKDTRYFTDTHQGLPSGGYSEMFRRILDHPRIDVMLDSDWFEIRGGISYDSLVFTGCLDRYFDFAEGKLMYRSLRFEYKTYRDREFYQSVGTVNYPNDFEYTRITEYKRLTGQSIGCTTIALEYPMEDGEPYYIVPDKEGAAKVAQYARRVAKERKTLFVGRLAEYRYYNMDQVANQCLAIRL